MVRKKKARAATVTVSVVTMEQIDPERFKSDPSKPRWQLKDLRPKPLPWWGGARLTNRSRRLPVDPFEEYAARRIANAEAGLEKKWWD